MMADALNYLCYGQSLLGGVFASKRMSAAKNFQLLSDNELVAVTLKGDNRAYEVLVRRYQKLVYNICHQLVQNHEIAADVTQDTFIKAFRGLPGFRNDAAFKPWLLRIATNAGLNKIRDERHRDYDPLHGTEDGQPGVDPPSDYNLENEVDWRLSQAMLTQALQVLSPRRRHVFLLRYQYDLTYGEISAITGETQATIKALLFRTREQLRNILNHEMQSTGAPGGR